MLRELPLKPWAACRREDLAGAAGDAESADRQTGRGGAATAAEENPQAKLLMTQPGVGPNTALAYVLTIGEVSRFPAGQAGGQLSGTDSARGKFGRTAEAGRDHQARQSHAAFVAGGSGADCGALRSRISPAVFASLSSEAEGCGQGGNGAQVSGTTLLDAAHPDRRIQRSFASRAARGCPWSAQARPQVLIGRSRIPQRAGAKVENEKDVFHFRARRRRRDVRIEESWSMFRPNRWLVERSSTASDSA
jgi:hypothetical protein